MSGIEIGAIAGTMLTVGDAMMGGWCGDLYYGNYAASRVSKTTSRI